MKFIAVLALTLSMVLVFASCKPQPPAVISSGKTFELATDKDGNALYDSSGKPIAVNIIVSMIKPAPGTPAVPIEASVPVRTIVRYCPVVRSTP